MQQEAFQKCGGLVCQAWRSDKRSVWPQEVALTYLWHLTITSCVSRNPLWSQFLYAVTTEKRRPHVLSGTPVLAFCMAMWFERERERESRAPVSWALAVSGTTVRRVPSIGGSGSSEALEGVASECQWHLCHPDYQTVTRLA